MPSKLEVCVDSIESALAAIKGGAHRIELCAALSEGGLTPTTGIFKTIRKFNTSTKIFCMLRPRQGNDFHYSSDEMDCILYDLQELKSLGSAGFVFGALDAAGNIDVDQCRQVINASDGLPVTFHRAFDVTDPNKMIDNCNLIESLGFKRILTSGYKQTAELGLQNLKRLIDNCHNSDLIIMPGSGINIQNAETILKELNCKEFHASCRKEKIITTTTTNPISMSNDNQPTKNYFTDSGIVSELVAIGKMS